MINDIIVNRKIGNTFFLMGMLVVSLTCAAQPNVVLVVKDINGDTLEQAAAGVPFIAEVVIHGLDGSVDAVTIKGTEKFSVARQGVTQSVQTMNGVTSSRLIHRFAVRIDSSGTYQLGPAVVMHSGREYSSQPIRVQVGKKKAYKQEAHAEIKMSIDKDLIVPGEATTFRIRFYADESVSLSRMSTPEFGELKVGALEGPFSGYDTTDGKNRYFLEWRTKIYADAPGSYRIPAVFAEYRIPRKNGSLMDDDFFAGLFSRGANIKQETSNSLEITVNNLPPTTKKVDAVGVFSAIHLKLDHTKAHVGDGIVLTLEIIGTENIERVQPPALTMPEGVTYYESKTYLQEQKTIDGKIKKMCEYIVQGTKAGIVTIPAQTFTFFNLYTRSYMTLTSNPVTLEITPAPALPVVDSATQEAQHETQSTPLSTTSQAGQLLDGPLYATHDVQMPWWLFILLISMPCIAMLGYAGMILVLACLQKHENALIRLFAFRRARQAIKRACSQGQYGQLYTIFKQVCMQRCGSAYATEDAICTVLREKKAREEELQDFCRFLHRLAAFNFSAARVQDSRAVQNEAQQWLDWLRKLI